MSDDNVVDFQRERLKRDPVAFAEEVLNAKLPLWQRQMLWTMMRDSAIRTRALIRMTRRGDR